MISQEISRVRCAWRCHSVLGRLVAALFASGLLGGCEQQRPTQIEPNAHQYEQTAVARAVPAAELGDALGIEHAKPAVTDSGEVRLQVRTLPLIYSDDGRAVNLAGEVTLAEGAQLRQTLWRQTAGPQGRLLNANQLQAQVILPKVAAATDFEFSLLAADTDGHVAEAHSRMRLDPLATEPVEPAEPLPASRNLRYTATTGGRIDGVAQQSLQPGNSGTLVTAIAEPGFVFTGWSDGQTRAQRTDTPATHLSVSAQFRRAELWLASGHSGRLSVKVGPTTATVNWPTEQGETYDLIVTSNPLVKLEHDSAHSQAEWLTNVTPPVRLAGLATHQPVYVALQANGKIQGWSSFVPRVFGANAPVVTQAIGSDGARYIGGRFTFIGPQTGAGVALPAAAGEAAHPLAGVRVDGTVYSAIADRRGGWYLGGAFASVNGQARNNLAQVTAAGQLTAWNPGANGQVTSLAIDQGIIYAGGAFSQAAGVPRARLAAFDAQGQLLPWNPGANNAVSTLAVDQGVIYAGGAFSQAGGKARKHLAAFDARGQLVVWNPDVNNAVAALAIDQGVIYLGGRFTEAGGEARNNLAAFDAQGQLLPWKAAASGWVQSLAVDQGAIYVGGLFSQAGEAARENLAAFDLQGQLLPWNPGANNWVRSLAVDQGVIYAGGGFNQAGGAARSGLAAFDGRGRVLPWNPGANNEVRSLAIDQGVIFAGGYFTQAGGEVRENLAAFDALGQLLPWNPGANNLVRCLAIAQGVIYVGGEFTEAGGAARAHLAAFDAQGQLLPWNPGTNNWVDALAIAQGVVYAGGEFSQAGGEARALGGL